MDKIEVYKHGGHLWGFCITDNREEKYPGASKYKAIGEGFKTELKVYKALLKVYKALARNRQVEIERLQGLLADMNDGAKQEQ